MDSEAENYYELLGINSNSSMEEIRDRYRYLVKVFHPDRFTTEKDKIQAENDLTKINVAYSVLSDPERRKKYDQDIDSRKKTSNQADEPLHPDDPQTGEIIEYIRLTQMKWSNKWEPTPNNNELSMLLSDTYNIFFLLHYGAYPFENQSKRIEKFKEFQGILYYVISSGVALGLEKKKNGIPKTIQEEKLIFVNAWLLYSYLSNIAEIISNSLLFDTTQSKKYDRDILELSVRVSKFSYEKYSHQVKIKSNPSPNPNPYSNPNPNPRDDPNPLRGMHSSPSTPKNTGKINFGCVFWIILIIVLVIAIAISGQRTTSVYVPTATSSTKSLVVTSPKVTPTKKPAYLTPTPFCHKWDTITINDKGKKLCVYGIVSDTYFEGDTFFIKFGEKGSDFRFLVFDGYYYSGIIGHCVVAEGIIRSDKGAPYGAPYIAIEDLFICD